MESEKERHRRWLVEALAAHPETSQRELADALGLDRSAVSKIISGLRGIRSDELYRAAEFLDHPLPGAGFAESASPFTGIKSDSKGLAPIYRVLVEGGRWLLNRNEPAIDARPRAPLFENAAEVFGFYAPDDAAAPRFKSGEIVWVDPARPIKPGDDALLAQQSGQRIFLGELRRLTSAELVFIDYQDGKERRYSKTHWKALHVFARH